MKCQMGWNKKFLHHRAKWKKKENNNKYLWLSLPSRLLVDYYSTVQLKKYIIIRFHQSRIFLSLMISYTCFSSLLVVFLLTSGLEGLNYTLPDQYVQYYVLSIYLLLLLLLRLQYSLKINTFRQTLVPLLLVVGYVYIYIFIRFN